MSVNQAVHSINSLVLYGHLNPLSPNSDQHQFSPNNVHMLPREMVMRVIKWSLKRKCFDLLSNSLN